MERFVRNGLTGRYDLPEATLAERRTLARAEAEHFTALMADEPIGVQIGIVPTPCRTPSFQIFRQPDGRCWRCPVGSASSPTSVSAWR